MILALAECYLYMYHHILESGQALQLRRVTLRAPSVEVKAVREQHARLSRHGPSLGDHGNAPGIEYVLFPEWEVLAVVSWTAEVVPKPGEDYWCVFQKNATSPARLSWVLPFSKRRTFKCIFPKRIRRYRPFTEPALVRAGSLKPIDVHPVPRELFRWTFLAYESLATRDDVVLFVKGVNHRQGSNRSPSELRCVFGSDATKAVRTAVIASSQEVFRCRTPDLTALPRGEIENDRIKISLEIPGEKLVVPSVAYYTPMRAAASPEPKYQLCACTMIYNAGKVLKEWAVYHSRIGVQKFLLYDNGSDDKLKRLLKELNREGINVQTVMWPWPKTQEAGFSHSVIYFKDTCKWMIYIDVDEFVFSPKWLDSTTPSTGMLSSFLPNDSTEKVGQISIHCYEFGPSDQHSHPVHGVTQGYTCRRQVEQRHKSVVLLEAVDLPLDNVVHHFSMKEGFRVKTLSLSQAVVNHYKYQAWSEFKTKFRRRVSAYVVDWTTSENPRSQDRTPGLGFLPIEPEGWASKFCEVKDERLKMLTRRWFGIPRTADKMAWEI